MAVKRLRVEVTREQLERLHQEVLDPSLELSGEQRRRAAKRILVIPANGGPVDVFCDGRFISAL